jgi:hypothetical protein
MRIDQLPVGFAPDPVALPHFPDRLHAYVWRNWQLVPTRRLAEVIAARPEDILAISKAMGLSDPGPITDEQQRRSHFTIIRRNWHLLPYEQLMALLGWSVEEMDFALREGEGLFWWLGGYKPQVGPLRYSPPTREAAARAAEISSIIRETFPAGVDTVADPLFSFIGKLSRLPAARGDRKRGNVFSPRYCYSYFGSFRNALATGEDFYPEGYLARLAETGVDGVWLHEPLYELAPFPWDESLSARRDEYIGNLRALVEHGRNHGIGIYIYLNEPRPMPLSFFQEHPDLMGIKDAGVQPDVATLCTSVPAVQDYLRDSVASLCRDVPDLAGLFTITASESYTNCWSHYSGDQCPRCSKRAPEEVIAEVNTLMWEGIARSGSRCRLIVWDWGWLDEWTEGILSRLPRSTHPAGSPRLRSGQAGQASAEPALSAAKGQASDVSFMSVSEWSLPIERGGVESVVGEYSLSAVGPGPRATRHWALARARGLKTIAKIQTGNCWELAAVPYIPVVENVARHVANLRRAGVDGLMLSWTLGGYPSPNMEAVVEQGRLDQPTVEDALRTVATRRFGAAAAPAVVEAWQAYSAAFREYPFHIVVLYHSPVHMGPANLLWGEATSFRGRGVTAYAFPFDDLDTWRGIYPAEVFAAQFEKTADGFDQALTRLKERLSQLSFDDKTAVALEQETGIAEACAIHFRSVANQSRFVMLRNELASGPDAQRAQRLIDALAALLHDEIRLAARLHAIQRRDSRIGFEAACQYFYVGVDLGEKVINCRDLLERWIPEQRAKYSGRPDHHGTK